MADPSITIRIRGRGLTKLARQFEALGRVTREAGHALREMPKALDMVYYRAVDKAERRSRATRPKRTRHGQRHPTR